MAPKIEVWRCEFRTDAYRDQTGCPRDGYIVYEQQILTATDETFDVNDGYAIHKNHGRIYVAKDDRRFRVWNETVDYSGGTHVVPEATTIGPTSWRKIPSTRQRYVNPQEWPIIPLGLDYEGGRILG